MTENVNREIEQVLARYLDVYFTKRDLAATLEMFCPGFTGYGTGLDENVYTPERLKEIYTRDISQAPNTVNYTIRRINIAAYENTGIVSSEIDIKTIILDQEVKLNNLRLSIVFIKQDKWLILHMHISFPASEHGNEESYPFVEIEDQNKVLKRLVEEKTRNLDTALKEINKLAVQDKLTGLYNRMKTDDVLEKEISRCSRYGNKLSIIIIDLDYFKQVNDNYGHLTGDKVLADAAKLIDSKRRKTDIAGRWGGEEFLVICPETSAESALLLAEKMRLALEKHVFEGPGKITACFGTASFVQGDTSDSLLSRADIALYEAKNAGRNRVVAGNKKNNE